MKLRLLIADNNGELCIVCQKFLTQYGYDVETSLDGLDCLAKLRAVNPAVLVLDLDLRWGGGQGVLAYLREENAMPWIPVVLTATASSPQEVTELINPPVVDCLSKPFSLTDLLLSVRSAVAKEQALACTTNEASAFSDSDLFIG